MYFTDDALFPENAGYAGIALHAPGFRIICRTFMAVTGESPWGRETRRCSL